ncbi:MAG: invasion associated locus B family protein [Alphaproteobacteria bacterium]|nr:invasion associated locus B family protein [Alphaproteobacteria bacterium]OIN85522.1 MAG: hypothetical protein AUJ12_09065 [Alphaproteobacteria bacterium CG1_02_46_17]
MTRALSIVWEQFPNPVLNNILFLLACFLLLSTSQSYAASPVLIGTYGDWKAYSYKESSGQVCFMSSVPIKAEGKYAKRGDVFAMVTHRPAEKSRDVFSYITGYTYKKDANISVKIDGESFILAGQGENAWTTSDEMDKKLALAIQKGSSMIVEGISSRGTKTKDTFSLKGSGDAYGAINKACGM